MKDNRIRSGKLEKNCALNSVFSPLFFVINRNFAIFAAW